NAHGQSILINNLPFAVAGVAPPEFFGVDPLIDPDTGALYKAGNFYGGHIARLLDTWKIDFATMATWGNALVALLVDDRFNGGLPANLTPQPGVNSGFKGMQLSVTSLTCAVRQMAGPSSIHSL